MTRNEKHKSHPKRRRTVSDAERALWEAFTRDVVPLRARRADRFDADLDDFDFSETSGEQHNSDTALPLPDNLASEIAKSEENRTARNLPSARNADRHPAIRNPQSAELQAGNTDGIDRRTAQKFQKGKMSIDGRIDLHGMTQDVAHHALNAFIEDAWRAGKRCVLVITGKGSRADEYGRTGLLRQRTPQWLSAPRLRAKVLAISQARIEHGGAGAYYVLLKRRRS